MLPASAGMILHEISAMHPTYGAPRIRGDDPLKGDVEQFGGACSPHPRG